MTVAPAPSPAPAPSFAAKAWRYTKKVAASVAAALTTPTAVKAEKSLAVIVLVRLAVLVPGAAFLIGALVKYLGG